MTGEVTLHMALATNCPKTVKSILQARTGIPDYQRQDREMLETNVLNVAIMYGDVKSIQDEIFKERPLYKSDYYLNYAYDTAIELERHDLLEMLNFEINNLERRETGIILPPLTPPAQRLTRADRPTRAMRQLTGFAETVANAFRPSPPRPETLLAAAGAMARAQRPSSSMEEVADNIPDETRSPSRLEARPPVAPRLRPTPIPSTPPHPSIPDEIWRRLIDDAPREADGNLLRR